MTLLLEAEHLISTLASGTSGSLPVPPTGDLGTPTLIAERLGRGFAVRYPTIPQYSYLK